MKPKHFNAILRFVLDRYLTVVLVYLTVVLKIHALKIIVTQLLLSDQMFNEL